MSIEIIGMVGTKEISESRGSFAGPQISGTATSPTTTGGTRGPRNS